MAKGDFNYFSGSANKDERVGGKKEVKNQTGVNVKIKKTLNHNISLSNHS